MATEELLQYIVREEQEGFSREVISRSLLKHGYTKAEVEEAFRQLEGGGKNEAVRQYVQEYARQGQSAGETYDQLRQQGYDPSEIRRGIRAVYGRPEAKPHTAVFMLIAVFIGAGGMWLMLHGFTPAAVVEQPSYSPSEYIALAIEDVHSGGNGLEECDDNLDGLHREKCYAAIASASGDSSICSSIRSDEIHDSCWMAFIDVRFEEVCEAVRLPENRQTCQSIRSLRA